ncbi:hypothetical protein [Haloarcula amylovorans]|uniref:hypothetical protein n=1 Tax=Haloarcula amylovorans TaxID=2562280 RepID=UPI001076456B|nr:hypothetical protein [Halomicroarcula amylolytica]
MTTIWRAIFASSLVLLALLGLSVPYIEPGTGTFVISLMSLGMLVVMLVASAAFIYFNWDPFAKLLESTP